MAVRMISPFEIYYTSLNGIREWTSDDGEDAIHSTPMPVYRVNATGIASVRPHPVMPSTGSVLAAEGGDSRVMPHQGRFWRSRA